MTGRWDARWQCFLSVDHKTEGKFEMMFPHKKAMVRCEAEAGTGTYTGDDMGDIKRIEFLN